MKRRVFLGLIVVALSPLAGFAQQSKFPVVGFVNSASAEGYAVMATAFRRGLKDGGYSEGENVQIEFRWADNQYDRVPALVSDLVERRVDVIFANSPIIAAAKAATGVIPIVFTSGDDPVRLGFVASLNKPGGNITGIAILSGELASKRLALLRDIVPGSKRIAILTNTDFGPTARFQIDIEEAARKLDIDVYFLHATNSREIEAAFENLSQTRPDALLVGPGPFFDSQRQLLVQLTAKLALPAGYESRATAAEGGLKSYGASVADAYRQAGVYTARILKGEKPADLPVIQASKVDFVVNLKTAKALGISIREAILLTADELIE
jgi:putative ABC transport system substrate-binding protein